MGALMIVVPAHVRNLSATVCACHNLTNAGEVARCKPRAKKRYSDKNQKMDDWLAAIREGGLIDVPDGNR
jgi:hypothetical protein